MRCTRIGAPWLILLLAMAGSAFAQSADVDDPSATIRRGIRLFDAGDLAGARAAFESVLAVHPDHPWARYELAYTHLAAGEHEQCITEAGVVASGRSPYRAQAITLVGNCLAAAGREKDALKEFRKGLKEFPDDVELNFNAAVSLVRLEKTKDANKLLKRALGVNPRHASSLFIWAVILNGEGNRVPALLTSLRFLMLDRTSERATTAAEAVLSLLGAGIERQGNDVNLSLPADTPKDEGNFTSVEFGVMVVAAGMSVEGEEAKPVAQRTVDALESAITIADEMADAKLRKTDVWKLAAAPLVDLHKQGLWQPYGYAVAALAGVEGASDWVASHAAEISSLEEYLKPAT